MSDGKHFPFTTTGDLLFHFHAYQLEISSRRQAIASGKIGLYEMDALARANQDAVERIRKIVQELRRRGHSVEWEE